MIVKMIETLFYFNTYFVHILCGTCAWVNEAKLSLKDVYPKPYPAMTGQKKTADLT